MDTKYQWYECTRCGDINSTRLEISKDRLGNFKEVHSYYNGIFRDVKTADWFVENVSTAYELGLFVTGIMQGLTYFGRLPSFLLTSAYTCLVMIPLYTLVNKTGLIGGNTWKE